MFFLLTFSACLAADTQPDEEEKDTAVISHSVTLNSDAQTTSGVKTQTVHKQTYANELETMGKVISIQPLLALRSRYQIAKAELSAAEAKLKHTRQNLERQQSLFRDGIGTKKSVQELTTQITAEQAIVDAASITVTAIANETKINWGDTLARWTLAGPTGKVKALLSGRQNLIQITVPVNRMPGGVSRSIFVEPSGRRALAHKAEFVAKAPHIDTSAQGANYFFLCDLKELQIGMKITAWLPEQDGSETGMLVPESAPVWYLDQLFIYVKAENNRFRRQHIQSFLRTRDGYLMRDGLKEGDEIVVIGGQMLLSEDLRQQIPDED